MGSVVIFCATASAQGWTTLSVGAAPPARNNHAAAYDFVAQHYVIFGSQAGPNDTWVFDGSAWSQVTSPTAPPMHYSSQMAMDLLGPGVMVFGGSLGTASASAFAETWRLVNGVWTQLAPTTSPPARIAHAMVSNINSAGVLLFGGRDAAGLHLNDTWWWDGTDWAQIAAGGPPARCCHDLAYDSLRDRYVLFGGWNILDQGDTWEWDGSTWTEMIPAHSPTARWGHRMAYDPSLQRVVLQGGSNGDSETWLWDGTDWSQLATTGPNTMNHSLHYDQINGRLLSFGGYLLNSDLRAFDVQSAPTLTEFGAGCAGPGGSPHLAASGTALPFLGMNTELVASNVPALGLFVLGYSNTSSPVGPLPASLAAIGMPGCDLLVSNDVIVGGTQAGGQAMLPLAVPLAPTLVGTSVYAQALSLDLAANALGFTASNGLQLGIGQL